MSTQILRYIGLAEEASFNVSPAPAAVVHLDVTSIGLDVPSDTELVYEGSIGRGLNTHRPGFYAPEGPFAYAIDIRTVAYLLKWTLNGYTYFDDTVGSGFHIHEAYADESTRLQSFCVRAGKDEFEHIFSGCVSSGITLAVEDEFASLSVDVLSAKDAQGPLTPVGDLLLPAEYPLAFHEVTVSRNAADVSAQVPSLELSIDNSGDVEGGRGLGSRYPYRIPVGSRDVTLNMDMLFEDMTNLETFWGGTGGPADTGTSEIDLNLHFDAGTDGNMDLDLPRTIFESVETQPSGREEITQSVTARSFLADQTLRDGTTVVSTEVLATIRNLLSGAI